MSNFSDLHIYFGGAGFSCAFYIGVVKALQEKFPNQIPKISGDSAGSLIGLAYALNIHWTKLKQIYLESLQIQKLRNNKIWFGEITKDHGFIIDSFLKTSDFNIIKNNDKFNVGVTHFFYNYKSYTNWTSKYQLKNILNQSMIIPFLTKTQFTLQIDGGLSNYNSYDVSIGCSQNYDIGLYQTNYEKLNMITPDKMNKLIELGYNTTKQFDFNNYTINRRLLIEKQSLFNSYNLIIIMITWFLKFLSFPFKLLNIIK